MTGFVYTDVKVAWYLTNKVKFAVSNSERNYLFPTRLFLAKSEGNISTGNCYINFFIHFDFSRWCFIPCGSEFRWEFPAHCPSSKSACSCRLWNYGAVRASSVSIFFLLTLATESLNWNRVLGFLRLSIHDRCFKLLLKGKLNKRLVIYITDKKGS